MQLHDNGTNNKINPEGLITSYDTVIVTFNGNNNTIDIGSACDLKGTHFVIDGDNHKIHIGNNVQLHNGAIVFESKNNTLRIGNRTRIFSNFFIAVAEPNRTILIGDDCLFSWNVRMRTTDSHAIHDLTSHKRINYGADIIIEDRVWIGESVNILKAVRIKADSIVGTGSIVTSGVYDANSIVAGNPARVIKSNVYWTDERHDC